MTAQRRREAGDRLQGSQHLVAKERAFPTMGPWAAPLKTQIAALNARHQTGRRPDLGAWARSLKGLESDVTLSCTVVRSAPIRSAAGIVKDCECVSWSDTRPDVGHAPQPRWQIGWKGSAARPDRGAMARKSLWEWLAVPEARLCGCLGAEH